MILLYHMGGKYCFYCGCEIYLSSDCNRTIPSHVVCRDERDYRKKNDICCRCGKNPSNIPIGVDEPICKPCYVTGANYKNYPKP